MKTRRVQRLASSASSLWKSDPGHFVIVVIMYGAVLLALGIASFGVINSAGPERYTLGVESCALLAASIAILYERQYQLRERSDVALRAMAAEMAENSRLLARDYGNPKATYPRIVTSSVETAISSGILFEGTGPVRAMVSHVAAWRAEATLFNHRLDIHELVMLLKASDDDIEQMHKMMLQKKEDLELQLNSLTLRIQEAIGTLGHADFDVRPGQYVERLTPAG